jgi:hypothetical protein
MSASCWQALGSPALVPSPTMLQAFYGHSFQLKGIIVGFPIELGGKTVTVDVEVVDSPLDYNLQIIAATFHALACIIGWVGLIAIACRGKAAEVDRYHL